MVQQVPERTWSDIVAADQAHAVKTLLIADMIVSSRTHANFLGLLMRGRGICGRGFGTPDLAFATACEARDVAAMHDPEQHRQHQKERGNQPIVLIPPDE